MGVCPALTRSPGRTRGSALPAGRSTSVREPKCISPILCPVLTLSPISIQGDILRATMPAICITTARPFGPSIATRFWWFSSFAPRKKAGTNLPGRSSIFTMRPRTGLRFTWTLCMERKVLILMALPPGTQGSCASSTSVTKPSAAAYTTSGSGSRGRSGSRKNARVAPAALRAKRPLLLRLASRSAALATSGGSTYRRAVCQLLSVIIARQPPPVRVSYRRRGTPEGRLRTRRAAEPRRNGAPGPSAQGRVLDRDHHPVRGQNPLDLLKHVPLDLLGQGGKR